MIFYGLEHDDYKDSTKNHLLQCMVCKKKIILIHWYYNTMDKQPFKFLLHYSHLLPSKRKECSYPPRKACIQTQLFLRGCGVYLSTADILGDVRKRL